jgi:hypothetical protein
MEASTQAAPVRRNAGNRAARTIQVEDQSTVIASSAVTSEGFGGRAELTATATMDLAGDRVRFAFARRAIDGTERIGQLTLDWQEIPAALALLAKVGVEAGEVALWVESKRERAR